MDEGKIRKTYGQLDEDSKGFVDFREIPYIKYHVDECYNPRRYGLPIRCLFVAEAPSPTRYFYDNNFADKKKRSILRTKIFDLLNIENEIGGLDDFRDKGYFFIDTIKLVLRKTSNKNIPSRCMKQLIDCSANLLRDEIESELSPQRICLMGETARSTFLQSFPNLKNQGYDLATKVTKIPPLSLALESYKVFIMCLPFHYPETWERQIRIGLQLNKEARP